MQQQILGLVNPIMAMLFAMVFLYLWSRDRSAWHVAGFAASFACLAIGFLLFHYAPDPDDVISSVFVHAFYSASVLGLAWSTSRRVGAGQQLAVGMTIAVIAGVAVAAASFAPNQVPRLFAANTSYGLIFALTAQVLSRSSQRDAIDRMILWLVALTSAQFFLHPYVAFFYPDDLTAFAYRDSAFYSVTIVFIAAFSLMLAMALVAACIVDQFRVLKDENREDDLTGLLVRKAFEQDAVSLLEEAHAKELPVCAVVADIDHFKRVNDIWGHQAGDNAIAGFGKLLSDAVRSADPVGRIGGEEFCILVKNCHLAGAMQLAERIRTRFTELRVDGVSPDLHMTASFGVAEGSRHEGYGKLFARADAALYAAKEAGRNRVETAPLEKRRRVAQITPLRARPAA